MKLPRFSLRELFLLVVIAAMGCGWWVDRRRHAEELDAVVQGFMEELKDHQREYGKLLDAYRESATPDEIEEFERQLSER